MNLPPWECGSEFHWPDLGPPEPDAARDALVVRPLRRYATGRAAIAGVVEHCRAQRLWIPSYFCPEVSEALEAQVPLAVYPDAPVPGHAPHYPQARSGDAILIVNTFAIRRATETPAPPGVTIIEDHTHDPISTWAQRSTAHYCVASLRKTLPLPDGAIAWAPTGASLPPPIALSETPDQRKLTAMVLKRLYLSGYPIEKQTFRTLAIEGEIELTLRRAMSHLTAHLWGRLPLSRWRNQRGENFDAFRAALGSIARVTVLERLGPADPPFSIQLSFDEPSIQQQVRQALIAARIYPAILWDLAAARPRDGITAHDKRRAQTLLSIHCDARYCPADLERVATCVRTAL